MTAPDRDHLTPVGPSRADAVRYGSAMLRRFGWFYRILGLGRLLARLEMDEASVDHVRRARERGPLVYVMLRPSTVDHLALNTTLNKRRLPLSLWADGMTSFYWQPVAEAWADVGRRVSRWWRRGATPDAIESGWLKRTVSDGGPVVVFAEPEPGWVARRRGQQPADPLATVLAAQDDTERPIQLVPVMVVWNRAYDRERGATWTFLLGSRERPGALAPLTNLLWRSRNAFVQVGEAIDVPSFLERIDEPDLRVRTLQALLRRTLRREATTVHGPKLLPRRAMRSLVLDNPPMRELARAESSATGRSYERVRRQMTKDFEAIAANLDFTTIRLLDFVLRPLWTRVYSGVDARPEDFERIRSAIRGGTAVLVPCHKSHFDYLLLSWVLYDSNLIVPHIVAGMNLAIWPVSILLRGGGGFFVKRKLRGERVFSSVFARYVRELVRQGYPLEFFIEGGRTRSGKLLPPKLGVLEMVFDAAEHRRADTEVTLLPVALAYEQVAEAGAYVRELGGEEKRPESLGQVVKARSVLRHRYGRVYMRVGEPIPLSSLVDGSDDTARWRDRDRADRREVLYRVGETVLHRIGTSTPVLPTSLVATALLVHHRLAIRQEVLLARFERLRAFLRRQGALEAASLSYPREAALEALDRFRRQGLVVDREHDGQRLWVVEVSQRIALDFHKNELMPRFARAALTAAAVRALPKGPFTLDDVRERFLFLLWILRRELFLDPDESASNHLEVGLAELVAHGALSDEGGRMRVADPALIGEVYGMLRPFLEAYAAVLRGLDRAAEEGVEVDGLSKWVQGQGPSLQAAGAVRWPEALSLVTIDNAVRALTDARVVFPDNRSRVRVDAVPRDRYLDALAPMVD